VPLSIRENKSINRSQRDDEIIKWLELNYVKSIEVNIPHKPKKEIEVNIPHNNDDLITVNYGKGDSRRTIQLESFYFHALKQIGIDDIAVWLLDTVGTLDKQTKGSRTGTAKKVKHAIVNELLSRIPKQD
ncbi:MAG: hypothetical protein WBI40_13080, partial [Methylococcaceae bacterium]